MQRYRFDIAYDGTAYAGWQIQPNGVTIQEVFERSLSELAGQPRIKVHGSGRTDQGVHARKQVAHADMPTPFPVAKLKTAMNALLPPDIRVMRVQRVHKTFHARRHATGKEYRYFVWNDPVVPPLLRYSRTQIRQPLDLSDMQKAAALLVGRNDFAAFTANPNRVVESTVRDLRDLRVKKQGKEFIIIAIGEGFLYKMVRSLAGFLIRVGHGAESPDAATEILHSKTRTARVPTAPPEGLFLWNVTY